MALNVLQRYKINTLQIEGYHSISSNTHLIIEQEYVKHCYLTRNT